jgi:hypothetical protein
MVRLLQVAETHGKLEPQQPIPETGYTQNTCGEEVAARARRSVRRNSYKIL